MSSQQVNRNAWIYARGAKPLHFNYKTCVHIFSPVPRVPSARSEEPALQGLGHDEAGAGGGSRATFVLPGQHPRDQLLPWGLCRRDLAGGDGGGLCLASRCVLVTQWVLATAEGCDHAVTELGEREAQGEPDIHYAALAAEPSLSPAGLLGSPRHRGTAEAVSIWSLLPHCLLPTPSTASPACSSPGSSINPAPALFQVEWPCICEIYATPRMSCTVSFPCAKTRSPGNNPHSRPLAP